MQFYKAPAYITPNTYSLFLAGSIEMGKAVDWQTDIENCIRRDVAASFPINILNPRRTDWDASWVQSINNTQFKEQVDWEQDGLENSDILFFYFAPGTNSPITLLEFGQALVRAENDHNILLIVCCPEGFNRKGNVEIACDRHPTACFFDNFDEATKYLVSCLTALV